MKKTIAALLTLIMAVSVAGCSTVVPSVEGETATQDGQVTIYDYDAAVATVGDEHITFGEYSELFDTYAQYYSAIGYDLANDADALRSFQDFVMDVMIEEKVVAYQAKQAGYDQLSPDRLDEAKQTADAEFNSMMEILREQAKTEAADSEDVDYEQRLAEIVADESEYYTGMRMTEEELGAWILDYYQKNAVSDAFREAMLADVTVSDEEVQAWYDETSASDKEAYSVTPENYKDDKESEELYGDSPVLYAPDGYKRMLHIFITPEEAISSDYDDKMMQIDELRTEYGELAFKVNVEGGDGAKRMEEIVNEYRSLMSDADKILSDYMAPALAKAKEAYAKLEAGEEFAAVAETYSQDTEVPENGRLISNDYVSDYDWSNKVKSAFATLKPGEYSQIIEDDEGCHILYYLGDEPSGYTDIETVREAIKKLLLADAQDAEWEELIKTWKNDKSVSLNDELIHSLAYAG